MPSVARRARSRVKEAPPLAKYDAAGNGRRVAGWRPPSSGPNRAIEGLQRIRDRSRDATRNDWAGESGIQKWVTNLVGVGIVPRWKNARVTALWRGWVSQADADGVLDLYGLQALVTRAWLDGGECFVRRRSRPLLESSDVPVQLQVIESDYVPVFDVDQWPKLPAGHTIRQGIERNRFGRRTAYWMYREHPGDRTFGQAPRADELIRVAASEVAHVFEPKRPGQLRGVSMLAPVLLRLRSSMDFEDAVLDRQKLANLFTMFITRQLPPEFGDVEYDPLTGLPSFYDAQSKTLVGLEPGMSQELLPGEDVRFANPPEAGTTYDEYMRRTGLGNAAGQGLPYEVHSGDIRDVSDRTLRVVINEFRRFAQQRQWHVVIPQFCQRSVEWFAQAALLSGRLNLAEFEEARAPKHSPHGWEYIHPTQDAEGKKTLIEIGVASRDGVIAERGDDPEEIDRERAEAQQRERALKIETAADLAARTKPAPTPKPKALELAEVRAVEAQADRDFALAARARAPEPVATGPTDIQTLVAAFVAAQAESQSLVAAIVAGQERSAALFADALKAVGTRATEVAVANTVNVEPTPVNVANTVNVEPTPVNVANTVNVEPTPVVFPEQETESTVVRDEDGEMIGLRKTTRNVLN